MADPSPYDGLFSYAQPLTDDDSTWKNSLFSYQPSSTGDDAGSGSDAGDPWPGDVDWIRRPTPTPQWLDDAVIRYGQTGAPSLRLGNGGGYDPASINAMLDAAMPAPGDGQSAPAAGLGAKADASSQDGEDLDVHFGNLYDPSKWAGPTGQGAQGFDVADNRPSGFPPFRGPAALYPGLFPPGFPEAPFSAPAASARSSQIPGAPIDRPALAQKMLPFIAQLESGGQDTNPDGSLLHPKLGGTAVGEYQIKPGTAQDAAKWKGLKWDNQLFYDTSENGRQYRRQIVAAELERQLTHFGDDTNLAATAYNGGGGAVQKLLNGIGDPRSGIVSWDQFAKRIPRQETSEYLQKWRNLPGHP